MQLMLVMALALAAQDVNAVSPGGMEAIGPKQDDPRAMCETDGTALTGLMDKGRVRTSSSSGMQPAPGGGTGMLSQGRVRLSTSTGVKPGSENDPKAAGGGGGLAIGPKQDDPRSPGVLAIGPKQDDPRSPNLVARPGDDDDPQALAACGAKAR